MAITSQMAHLQQLLFVLLCMSTVAIAVRGKQFLGPQRRLEKEKAQFPSCNIRHCWPKIARCNLFRTCFCVYEDRQNPSDCPCCKKCERCLGHMWNYCCDCLKICPPLNTTVSSDMVMSTAGDLEESIPSLFEALSYGTNLPFEFANHKPTPAEKKSAGANGTSPVGAPPTPVTCKVGFFHDCTTLDTCQDACHDLGSSRYRWFHNGCCECVGDRCTDHGKTKSLCKNCGK